MLALDAVWWVIALRLVEKIYWRILISFFMVAQMAAMANELLGRVSNDSIDLDSFVPQGALAAIQIWHNLILPAVACVGFAYICIMFIKRYRSKKIATTAASIPAPTTSDSLSRREFIGASAALTPIFFTFGLTGIAMSQLNHFRLRRFNLSIPSLPKALDGLTIAHVSDIHVGEWTHGRILRDLVNATNDLRADMVVVTGDTINYEISDLPGAIDLIKKMESRYGTWMIEGNHDLYQTARSLSTGSKLQASRYYWMNPRWPTFAVSPCNSSAFVGWKESDCTAIK
jgi:uncharacterized protein